jgi:hypothetical protein
MRVRIDKPGQRIPARQFLRIARSRHHTFARKPSGNAPEKVHDIEAH